MTKIAPAFGALVKVAPEKPTMLTACATPGTFSAMSTARRLTVVGARERGARRQLRDDDEIAAVELRDEADRRLAEFIEAEGDDAGIDHQHQHGDAHQCAPTASHSRASGASKSRLKTRKKPWIGLLHQRSSSGSPCGLSSSAHSAGDSVSDTISEMIGRAGDGERELPVELSGNAGDEGRRHEHRRSAPARSRSARRRPRPCS